MYSSKYLASVKKHIWSSTAKSAQCCFELNANIDAGIRLSCMLVHYMKLKISVEKSKYVQYATVSMRIQK